MNLAAIPPFVPIVPSTMTTFRRRLPRRPVEHDRRGLRLADGGPPQDRAQIVHHRLEAPGRQPTSGLLIDCGPGWEVGGQVATRGAEAHDPAESVEDLTQVMAALGRIFRHQAQLWGDKG